MIHDDILNVNYRKTFFVVVHVHVHISPAKSRGFFKVKLVVNDKTVYTMEEEIVINTKNTSQTRKLLIRCFCMLQLTYFVL